MLFQSAILTRGSGSIGGVVASHNAGGNYLRARTTPTDPGTSFQTAVRTTLASLQNIWTATLTQAQRDAWTTYAFNTPLLNPFGEPRTVTGLNMFTRVNVPGIQAGLPRIDDAPTDFNTGDVGLTSAAFSAAAGISISFDVTDEWVDEDDSGLLIYASRPQSIGVNFFKGPWRFAGVLLGDGITPLTSPQGLHRQ